MVFRLIVYRKNALEHVDKLCAFMLMGERRATLALREFSQIRGHVLFRSAERQHFKEITRHGAAGSVRKAQAFSCAHDGEHPARTLIREEMFKAHIEHHRNAGERRECRHELAVFELGEHGGRQPGVLTEVDQRDLLLEPELPEFLPDVVATEQFSDCAIAFSGFQDRFIVP